MLHPFLAHFVIMSHSSSFLKYAAGFIFAFEVENLLNGSPYCDSHRSCSPGNIWKSVVDEYLSGSIQHRNPTHLRIGVANVALGIESALDCGNCFANRSSSKTKPFQIPGSPHMAKTGVA